MCKSCLEMRICNLSIHLWVVLKGLEFWWQVQAVWPLSDWLVTLITSRTEISTNTLQKTTTTKTTYMHCKIPFRWAHEAHGHMHWRKCTIIVQHFTYYSCDYLQEKTFTLPIFKIRLFEQQSLYLTSITRWHSKFILLRLVSFFKLHPGSILALWAACCNVDPCDHISGGYFQVSLLIDF